MDGTFYEEMASSRGWFLSLFAVNLWAAFAKVAWVERNAGGVTRKQGGEVA